MGKVTHDHFASHLSPAFRGNIDQPPGTTPSLSGGGSIAGSLDHASGGIGRIGSRQGGAAAQDKAAEVLFEAYFAAEPRGSFVGSGGSGGSGGGGFGGLGDWGGGRGGRGGVG